MIYGVVFLIIIAVLLNRHRKSATATELSKRAVFGLFVAAVIVLMFVDAIVAILIMAAIGVYVLLHQQVSTWERELVEKDRVASMTKQPNGKSVTGPKP